MTLTVIEYLTPEKKDTVSRVAFIVATCNAPGSLKSRKAEGSVLKDLNAFKTADTIQLEWDYEVGNYFEKA